MIKKLSLSLVGLVFICFFAANSRILASFAIDMQPKDAQTKGSGEWSVYLPGVQSGQSVGFLQHNGKRMTYDGAATCLECHPEEVSDFAVSNHYLWEGKLGALNDFCGLPDINFDPVKLTTIYGTQVDEGCATCHAGMGELPSAENPENADCLTCHAEDYRRVLVDVAGEWRFQPDRASMPDTITIQGTPTRYACLTCHAGAGNGDNHKRGDLSEILAAPTLAQDVHMGSGMTCVDCHLADGDHHIAGRGVDLRVDEGVAMRECASCHVAPESFHAENTAWHLDTVACVSCHIPAYARAVPTEISRDFQEAVLTPDGLYEAEITRQSAIMPVYAFWNGASGFYLFKASAAANQALAWPLGDIQDGKLFPFKKHAAVQPQDPVTSAILPLKTTILYQTGNLEQAILAGAQESGIPLTQGYTYLDTQRWMGIFHEIPPAEQVLGCADCHESASRVDFSALGYDPRQTRDGKPLCASCHGNQESPDFYLLHDHHVRAEAIACSECHFFTR